MPQAEILLEIKHLSKTFAGSQPLKDINCVVRQGEVISIIGPSGTGKSTLLRCINRLETPDGGQIFFHGEEIIDDVSVIRRMRQKIGMVFQSFNLFSNMNVLENIIKGPMMLKNMSKADAVKRAMELLETVGLTAKVDAYPDELSGGQKQRVAIVRALAMEPEIILFDEPTSALDPRMVDDVLSVMRSLSTKNYTMMIVTHEMRFAEKVSDRIFFVNEGIIYEEGTPQEIFHAPKKDATKIFINRLKTFTKIFEDDNIDLPEVHGEIEAFARKQFMSSGQSIRLQLIFEELIYEMLITRRKNIFPVEMTMMYNDTAEKSEMSIVYGGEMHNPLESADEDDIISLDIVKAMSDGAEFHFDGKNVLTVKVK